MNSTEILVENGITIIRLCPKDSKTEQVVKHTVFPNEKHIKIEIIEREINNDFIGIYPDVVLRLANTIPLGKMIEIERTIEYDFLVSIQPINTTQKIDNHTEIFVPCCECHSKVKIKRENKTEWMIVKDC